MKKIFLALALLTGTVAADIIPAQAQVRFSINIGSQPMWGPTGYDYAGYYYMPDINAYYNVASRQFVCYNGGQWGFYNQLPGFCGNYDLYNGYKVVINEPNPWMRHDYYRNQYAGYRGRRGQMMIRDSRDYRYYQHPGHPRHNQWRNDRYDRRDNYAYNNGRGYDGYGNRRDGDYQDRNNDRRGRRNDGWDNRDGNNNGGYDRGNNGNGGRGNYEQQNDNGRGGNNNGMGGYDRGNDEGRYGRGGGRR